MYWIIEIEKVHFNISNKDITLVTAYTKEYIYYYHTVVNVVLICWQNQLFCCHCPGLWILFDGARTLYSSLNVSNRIFHIQIETTKCTRKPRKVILFTDIGYIPAARYLSRGKKINKMYYIRTVSLALWIVNKS